MIILVSLQSRPQRSAPRSASSVPIRRARGRSPALANNSAWNTHSGCISTVLCGCIAARSGWYSWTAGPAQKISANDLIAVSVYDSPELTRTQFHSSCRPSFRSSNSNRLCIGSASAQHRLSINRLFVPFQLDQSPELVTKGSTEREIRRSTAGASYAPILRPIRKPTQSHPSLPNSYLQHHSPLSTHNLVPRRNVLRRRIFYPLAS